MKLHKVELAYRYDHRSLFLFYVVADSVADAEALAIKTFSEYDYGDCHLHSVEIIAGEGQYTKPNILLIQRKSDETTGK